MQAIRVIIPGDFWDVQIYRGKLHLWTMSGSLTTIHWDRLVNRLAKSAQSAFAVRVGLTRGRALYGDQVSTLRAQPEFRNWILEHFDSQARQILSVRASDLRCSMLGEQDNPASDLPVDTDIYNQMLYLSTKCGIWKASVGKTKFPVSTRPTKICDLPTVSLRAKSHQLALAATGEGLFKLDIDVSTYRSCPPQQLSERHCERAEWAFQSIFATSTLTGGYLFSRYWTAADRESMDRLDMDSDRRWTVAEGGIFDDHMIAGALRDSDVSWACAEKIHTARSNRLTSSRLTQNDLPNGIERASVRLGDVLLKSGTERPISGGSSTFGSIVEFDDMLQIVGSDESQTTIRGPITRWRTYPRSINYENHLHVIFDDRLEIFAFYRDYFVDQRHKLFGIEYRAIDDG